MLSFQCTFAPWIDAKEKERNRAMAKEKIIRVWGLASGRNGTADAARGAFTWHEYETLEVANGARETDWLEVFWAEKVDHPIMPEPGH